ncbi:MAG: helix-turn-helix domain-containing protein [Clostridia bacterium]|nr:helix-turn-helix domain-containing protein [Clostridia bacterium]
MTNKTLQKLCAYYYATHYYPLAVWGSAGKPLEIFCTYAPFAEIFAHNVRKLKNDDPNPRLIQSSAGLYGAIRVRNGGQIVLIGPFLNRGLDDGILDKTIHDAGLSWAEKEALRQFLAGIPQYSYNQFLNLIVFFHYILNGEEISVTDHFRLSGERYSKNVGTKQTDEHWSEEQRFHGTYAFEQQMLAFVRAGDVEGLQAFFDRVAKMQTFTEGKLADDMLRQQKNLFIGLVAMVGKCGAIEGNLDVEQTYQLIDLYTQECEKCRTVDEVNVLRYNAIMDFTQRVAELRHPQSLSNEVYTALQFIKTHTNQPIGVPDVVACVQKSRSAFLAQFKRETGTTVAKAIMDAKLQEAKLLLRYSDKSLSEISSFLYFSGQPYFQNMFKKTFGVTPLEYRRKKQSK